MEVCGIEEAGRGPVIGPMVMAGVVIDEDQEQRLIDAGVKDSKLLTPLQRERLFDIIPDIVKRYEIVVLQPGDVDDALNDPDINLNWLEAITSAEIINKLKPEKAILDCPSNNPPAYTAYVRRHLSNDTEGIEIVSEHKADLNYPVVGAASILAKVTRDRLIEEIKHRVRADFGSGYPSDPRTVRFLKENYDTHKDIFRTTWKSYRNVAGDPKQKGLGEY